jgi:hypothetical protein
MLLGRSLATLFAVSLPLTAIGACSSSKTTSVASDAAPECPANLDDALRATCSAAAQTCAFLYACGPFGATATCACHGGRFSCSDVTGSPLDAAAAPGCLALGDAGACPPSETAADFAPCTEPGLQCAYPSACPSVPAYDSCQCVPETEGGATFHFECIPSCEFIPDASATTDSADDANDAPADASGARPDAPSSDARPDAPSSD